ncbi:hypothetical protein [Staphylococcus pettenkoferi]|uniref:hypothetical protein n=1 Tax=Staphylococcus pettenkoferi TaxID=170573 RepID=UPI002272C3AF|nr:hypothetical protein [Staphylococcus pettenkoferi]MCY1563854.1 hypothetical protein [Staphylococcus pettenkoferi]
MNKFQTEFLDVLIDDYKTNGIDTDFDSYAVKLNTYEWDDIISVLQSTFEGDLSHIIQFSIERLAMKYQETNDYLLLEEYRQLAMDSLLSYLDTLEVEQYG